MPTASAHHGTAVPLGLAEGPEGDPPHGRFGRMFRCRPVCDPGDEAIDELVSLMRTRTLKPSENYDVPAGFTYLGQMIDHDITFDPMSKLDRQTDPESLVNFRTPRFDLDSLYGAGPQDQPFLYDWKESEPPGVKLLVGRNGVDGTEDLPRNQQGRALVGDMRNDENVIVSQLHLLFLRFHNAVVDHVCAERKVPRARIFDEAQRIVRWHFQWIVAYEFLPKVVGPRMANEVLSPTPPSPGTEPTVHLEHYAWGHEPFIPVEFSVAAYRFGHSMVRDQYVIKEPSKRKPAVDLFPDLAGFTWLSRRLAIDWGRFFELPGRQRDAQQSLRVDTSIAQPLFDLPDKKGELPRLNLMRGVKLKLTSGQEVADAMDEPKLNEEELLLKGVPDSAREKLATSTPLWYYVLCEAQKNGKHLGPVGGRIVAEVLVGLLEGDPTSWLGKKPPTWNPGELNAGDFDTGKDFTMADLVRFAQRTA